MSNGLTAADIEIGRANLKEILYGLGRDSSWVDGVCDLALRALPASQEGVAADLEQTRVQLAGCGVAALGYGEGCKPGDYGWSASFGDVMALREKFEAMKFRAEGAEELLANAYAARPAPIPDAERLIGVIYGAINTVRFASGDRLRVKVAIDQAVRAHLASKPAPCPEYVARLSVNGHEAELPVTSKPASEAGEADRG